jgi:dipeptidyl aminopeptidase/acylaminoacyl peptidase
MITKNKFPFAVWLAAVLLMLPAMLAAQEKIAFHTSRDGNTEIYVMNTDGTNQTRLTYSESDDAEAAFSPDGAKIAYLSGRDGNFEIYSMNADGTNQTRLTINDAVDNEPAWSPDGSKITFTSYRNGNGEIWVMNADGTNQVNLTNHASLDMKSAWSPDGSKIVFQSYRDGNLEIYQMNPDGSNQINLTQNPGTDAEPAFSPDGSKIVLRSLRQGVIDIFVMNADGSNPVNLTNHPSLESQPVFSPDGTRIAFRTDRDGNTEIYSMNADGTNQVNLTRAPSSEIKPAWGAANSAPLLSNVAITAAVNEGGTATLSGEIADTDSTDGFTLTVNWGDGAAQVFTYPAGTTAFSETHVYEDDSTNGTPVDDYTVGLLLSDNRFGVDTDSVVVSVRNTAPVLSGLAVNPSSPGFNVPVALTGNYTDSGYNGSPADEELKVFVNWGDGQSGFLTTTGAPGAINETHIYALPGAYTVTVKVLDNDAGEAAQTVNVAVAPPPPPAAPTNLRVDFVGANRVQLAWADASNNENGFIIERCNNRGCANFVEIGRTNANATVYLDTLLVANTQYFYRLRAFNLGGASEYTTVIAARTLRR